MRASLDLSEMSDEESGLSVSEGRNTPSGRASEEEGWQRVQRARSLDPTEQEGADVARTEARFDKIEGSTRILDIFDDHCNHMQRLASARQALLGLLLVTRQEADQGTEGAIAGECVSFVRLPSDRFVGDARLRCVRSARVHSRLLDIGNTSSHQRMSKPR